jgi:hypothetical protein
MNEGMRSAWYHLREISNRIYEVVFPEYPEIGIVVVVICLLSFVLYLLRGNVTMAIKSGIGGFLLLTFLLFSFHELIRLVHHINPYG